MMLERRRFGALLFLGLVLGLALAMLPSVALAQVYHREELRIPFAEAGGRGLEAVLIRPAGDKRYPLALLSHGTPRRGEERTTMTPNTSYNQAMAFARRGFAVLVVMRRGYGDSDG